MYSSWLLLVAPAAELTMVVAAEQEDLGLL
jgi:hypothetical protein